MNNEFKFGGLSGLAELKRKRKFLEEIRENRSITPENVIFIDYMVFGEGLKFMSRKEFFDMYEKKYIPACGKITVKGINGAAKETEIELNFKILKPFVYFYADDLEIYFLEEKLDEEVKHLDDVDVLEIKSYGVITLDDPEVNIIQCKGIETYFEDMFNTLYSFDGLLVSLPDKTTKGIYPLSYFYSNGYDYLIYIDTDTETEPTVLRKIRWFYV